MGVWIEILLPSCTAAADSVTPLVGVWIEIGKRIAGHSEWLVTPLVGVWIEMPISMDVSLALTRHAPRGRVD